MRRYNQEVPIHEVSTAHLSLTRDRFLEHFQESNLQHLLSVTEFRKMLENEAVMDQIQRVIHTAHHIISPALNAYLRSGDNSQRQINFERLTSAYLDYYLLVCPCPLPDEHPGILAAEKRQNTSSISRNPDGSNAVWLSGKPSDNYRGQQRVPTEELTDDEAKDAWNWLGPEGLIVHTAGAAKLFEFILAASRMSIPGDEYDPEEKHPLNKYQQELLGTKLFDGAISLWGHDDGRTVTHDPIWHMIISHLISMDLGMPVYLRQDHDLATDLHLHKEAPLIDPSDEFAIADRFGGTALLWAISDSFSKFIDILPPEERGTTFDPKQYLQIRLPGSEARFLNQRNLNYGNPALARFYERQITLVQSVLDFIRSPKGLNVPSERLRLAFLQTDKYMHQFMDEKKLSYWLSQI